MHIYKFLFAIDCKNIVEKSKRSLSDRILKNKNESILESKIHSSFIKMILFLSFLFYVDATCLTTGIYNLAGLSPSVSVISSSINSSTQPILKFPSK